MRIAAGAVLCLSLPAAATATPSPWRPETNGAIASPHGPWVLDIDEDREDSSTDSEAEIHTDSPSTDAEAKGEAAASDDAPNVGDDDAPSLPSSQGEGSDTTDFDPDYGEKHIAAPPPRKKSRGRRVAVRVARPKIECIAPSRFDLDHSHPALQKSLEDALRAGGYWKSVERGLLSVSVVDLTQAENMAYAGVNDDLMLYAASLPKIAILLAVMDAVHAGSLPWTPELRRRLESMITISSNVDASWATDLVGLEAIANAVQDPRYCFYDAADGGGLWMGRAYRRKAETRREPLKSLSHAATTRQTARFFAMLDQRALVSPHMSERMLDVMAPPGHHHKFVGGIGKRRGVRFLARKSGTWAISHADGALIQHFGKRYVLTALAQNGRGERMLRDIAKWVDDIIVAGAHRNTI